MERPVGEPRSWSAEELQAILDNVADGIFVCDGEGWLTLSNESGLRIVGLSRLEEAEYTVFEHVRLLHVRDRTGRGLGSHEHPLARALAGEVVSGIELTLTNPQSLRDVHVRVSATPVRDRKGRVRAAVEVFRDVTELVELASLKEQFIAMATHELETPLAVIKGSAQALVRSGEGLSRRQRDLLAAIDRGAGRIDGIVRRLVDLSRLEQRQLQLPLERLDAAELVAEVTAEVAAATPELSIRLVRSALAAPVLGSRNHLRHVLATLLQNAVRFSPAAGDVEVDVTTIDGEVVVTVRDHGVGIPVERQARIFERFYQAHADTPHDAGGLGLGLFFARQIVEAHQGRIGFSSDGGKGSAFSVSLPLADPPRDDAP